MYDDRRLVSLGDVCHLTKGTSATLKTPPGPYPLIVTGAEPSSAASYQFDGEAVCVPLVSSTGHGHASLKRVHYASGRFAVANIVAACTPKPGAGVNMRWLWLFLHHRRDDLIVTRMKGTANVSLSLGALAGVPVDLPSLAEQRRIVDVVHQVDDVLQLQMQQAEALGLAQRHLLMQSLSGEWQQYPLIELFEHIIGGSWGSPPGEEAVRVLALGPRSYSSGRIDVDLATATARSLNEKRTATRALQQGDLILERSGGTDTQPVGRVLRMTQDAPNVVPSDFMRLLRPNPELVHPGYVFWWLWLLYQEGATVAFQTATTNIRNLNITNYLTQTSIPMPPKTQQEQLISTAEAFQVAATEATAAHARLLDLRTNLLTALLSGEHEIPDSYDDLLAG